MRTVEKVPLMVSHKLSENCMVCIAKRYEFDTIMAVKNWI